MIGMPLESYPRVLLVTASAFGQHTATANTMTNLFWGWPADRLALACGDTEVVEPGGGICGRIWRFSPADVPIDRTVRRLLWRRKEQILGTSPTGLPGGLSVSAPAETTPLHARLHGVASAWADLLPIKPPPAFWDWGTAFRPQVIYTMLGSIRWMNLVLRVAGRCGVPTVPHFMDDWPTTHYRKALNAVPRRIMLSRLRSILQRSPLGMAIGPAMAEEYQRRFGTRFESFMNCVDVPDACPTGLVDDAARPLKFLYVGGLHLDRWQALVDVGKALSIMRGEGIGVELVIHAPPRDGATYGEALSAIAGVRLGQSLSQDQVSPAMQAADVLVHVESFHPTVREYTRLSLSTKIPQYMASGRPILAYGPKELASCRYVEDCQSGIVVGERDADLLREAIRLLATDPSRRTRLGRCGWCAAREQHSGDKVRQRFRSILAHAAISDREATTGALGIPVRA